MDATPTDQPAIKLNRLTRRSRLVLVLTLLIAAFMRVYAIDGRANFLSTGFSVAVAAILWIVAYRYLNFTVALIAGLMYALSPWAVAWGAFENVSLIQLLLIIAFATAIYARLENKNRAWIISLLSCITGVAFYVYLLLYITLAQVDQAREPNINKFSNLDGFVYIAHVTTGIELGKSVGIPPHIPYPSEIWLLCIGMATLIGTAAIWFQRYRLIATLLTTWVVTTIMLYILWDFPYLALFEHTLLIPLIPALCLLAGAGVAWLVKLMPGKPYSRMIILAAYGVVFLSQALWWRGALRYLELMAR